MLSRQTAIAIASLAGLSLKPTANAENIIGPLSPSLTREVPAASVPAPTEEKSNIVVEFLKSNSPTELYAIALTITVLGALSRFGFLRWKQRLDRGEALEYILPQKNLIHTAPNGERTLMIRNMSGEQWVENILKHPALVKAFEKACKNADPQTGLIALNGRDGQLIRKLLTNSISAEHAGDPFELKHYLLFQVCEDPKNINRNFYTHPRIFAIDEPTLREFLDWRSASQIGVENDVHKIRILTLHEIAVSYFGQEALAQRNPIRLELALRRDHEAESHTVVDWDSVDLSALRQPRYDVS